MAGLLLLLCVVAVGAALGIVYLLYGPTSTKPLIAVPRASMTIIPAPRLAPARSYNPEAVFAVEHSMTIADAGRAAALITPVPVAVTQFAPPLPMPQTAAPMPPQLPAPLPAPAPQPQISARAPQMSAPPPAPPAARSRTLPPPTPSFARGRVTMPQPLARARAARGTDSPRSMSPHGAPRDTHPDLHDSFVDADPTMLGDETMAS